MHPPTISQAWQPLIWDAEDGAAGACEEVALTPTETRRPESGLLGSAGAVYFALEAFQGLNEIHHHIVL